MLLALILIGGCEMDSKAQPEKLPDTVAFQDEFTREFMVSPKEVKEGYYLFKSKTGGFTMWFPKDAKINRGLYEKHDKYYESSVIAGVREQENIIYDIDMVYENRLRTEDIESDLFLLSADADYNGEYTKIEADRSTIYFAKNEQHISVDNKKDIVYKFFAYIKSNHSHQGVQFIYGVSCKDADQGCHINVDKEEERAKMLMKSIEFHD
ncbi:putative lipoprotein YvcA [Parageobacillus thermoglucosidasius]|nr:putative lipoprotein YvcA [Parageobacillus thermoglucosidasius]